MQSVAIQEKNLELRKFYLLSWILSMPVHHSYGSHYLWKWFGGKIPGASAHKTCQSMRSQKRIVSQIFIHWSILWVPHISHSSQDQEKLQGNQLGLCSQNLTGKKIWSGWELWDITFEFSLFSECWSDFFLFNFIIVFSLYRYQPSYLTYTVAYVL